MEFIEGGFCGKDVLGWKVVRVEERGLRKVVFGLDLYCDLCGVRDHGKDTLFDFNVCSEDKDEEFHSSRICTQ